MNQFHLLSLLELLFISVAFGGVDGIGISAEMKNKHYFNQIKYV